MGYACPVCDVQEADAVHLANHLAVTASLGREEHRSWLDDHAPDWQGCSPAELGEIVAEYADEVETPEFERGPGRSPSIDAAHQRGSERPHPESDTDLDPEAAAVLEEARELTRQRQSADGSGTTVSDADTETE
ncbi:DUF5810 domain-containing protein [Halobacteria archaeon AArc-dxtr1]|nr:DUF5810 domain-containing protein [Halobacteria archaeon AArc-dxtr1]